MAENATGAALGAGATTVFDDADDLLARLFDLCSPEQKGRGRSPREVLAKLPAAERAQLLDRLPPGLRDDVRRLIGR
jgi:hypothetical protein